MGIEESKKAYEEFQSKMNTLKRKKLNIFDRIVKKMDQQNIDQILKKIKNEGK